MGYRFSWDTHLADLSVRDFLHNKCVPYLPWEGVED